MPLLPPVLIQGLLTVDEPAPGRDAITCAQAWFEKAWWPYYSGCAMLNPLALPAAQLAAQAVFVPLLALGMTPNPVPLTFFTALEGAVRASMAVTLIPGLVLPIYAAGIPSPAPLAPMLLPSVAVGLASGSLKPPGRTTLATALSLWMYTNTISVIAPPAVIPIF